MESPGRRHSASLDNFMTDLQVAGYLRVSVPTVHKLLRAGELTGIRVLTRTKAKRDWHIPRRAVSKLCEDHSNSAWLVPAPSQSAVLKHATLELIEKNGYRPKLEN
jgi:excisionase family DNA binding protein